MYINKRSCYLQKYCFSLFPSNWFEHLDFLTSGILHIKNVKYDHSPSNLFKGRTFKLNEQAISVCIPMYLFNFFAKTGSRECLFFGSKISISKAFASLKFRLARYLI